MKDGIPQGSGNSRYLKSVSNFKTLYPTYDAFVNALVAGTLPVDFNGINTAGWKQLGDALNKNNLLKDSTVEAMGLSADDNPQVDDAFRKLSNKHDNRFLIGDTLTTIRTDLSENWALCNGDIVYRDDGNTNAELYSLLDPGLTDRKMEIPGIVSGSVIDQLQNGAWSINYYGASSKKAAVFNPLTGFMKVVDGSEKGMSGKIISITWNGSKYVCCTISDVYLIFYTSSDLETWTEAARHAPEKEPEWSSTYGRLGFLWDGAAYRVACQYSGYQAHYLHTYDASFSHVRTESITGCRIYAADGLFCIGASINAKLYEPGSTTAIYTPNAVSSDSGYCVYEKFTEDKYVLVPLSNAVDTLRFYNKATNTANFLDVETKFANKKPVNGATYSYAYYCKSANFDAKTNELVLYLCQSDGTNFCEARISADADYTNADNYTLYWIENPYTGYYNNLLKYGDSWTNINGSYVRGPHPRTLPIISHDEAYTYIKVKEGE